jgi:hypothetical protein
MSLAIVVAGPEGIVLAAESRITLGATIADPVGAQQIPVSFDNATKLLNFSQPNTTVGVVTYGLAVIGEQNPRTASSFIPEFEANLPTQRLAIADFANELSNFFMRQWQANMPSNYEGPPMSFIIAGFNLGDVYGQVHLVEIPHSPEPEARTGVGSFGITFGGQHEIMSRILQGFDSGLPNALQNALRLQPAQVRTLNQALQSFQLMVPLEALALQDCVDLAVSFIRTTMEVQRFTIGIRGVGGAIDVAIITRNKDLQFIQCKEIHGEV